MKVCYYYIPLSPKRSEYKDDGTRVIASVPCKIENSDITEVALIGSAQEIELIRISIGKLSEEQFPTKEGESIDRIKEDVLASLRLTYDPNIDFVRYRGEPVSIHNFIEEKSKPELSLQISELVHPEYTIASQNIVTAICLFNGHPRLRNLIRLLTDSQVTSIPIQYRYLSLYKILEMEFPTSKGRKGRLASLLNPFQNEFETLAISNKGLWKFIEAFRQKCAHIETGNAKELGIVGIDSKDALKVLKFMPLFGKIIKRHLNDTYSESGVKFI